MSHCQPVEDRCGNLLGRKRYGKRWSWKSI